MSRLPRNTLPKDSAKRTVAELFPQTQVQVTPQQVQQYGAAMPYAFGIDRQSDEAELTRAQATGIHRRVEAICNAAQARHLKLPVPVPNLKRVEGELLYQCDPDYWFIDGEKKNATGFAASQDARPRLWDAFLLAQALSAERVGPKEFLIGEPTRLFRAEKWLSHFVHALWDHGITVYVCGFEEVNRYTLPGLIAYINAMSGWLPMIRKGARELRRQQRRLFANPEKKGGNPPYGVYFSEDATEVVAHAEQWPILYDLVERLSDGRLTTARDGAAWLLREHNVRRSGAWLARLLRGFRTAEGSPKGLQLEGEYICYGTEHEARQVVQKGGLFWDLDIRSSGSRRYMIHDNDHALRFPIQHKHHTHPIPIGTLQAARALINNNPGRPRVPQKHADRAQERSLLPTHLMKCAVCGASVRELAPRRNRGKVWRLQCMCVDAIRVKEIVTLAEAQERAMARNPHVLAVHGRLTHAVWDAVMERLCNAPIPEVEVPDHEEAHRQRKIEGLCLAQEAFADFQRRCARGDMGDQALPMIRQSIEAERSLLIAAVTEAEAAARELHSDRMTRQQRHREQEELREQITLFLAEHVSWEERRLLLTRAVREVRVHLEEGWFTVTGKGSVSLLQGLMGKWEMGEIETSSALSFDFCVHGTLATNL